MKVFHLITDLKRGGESSILLTFVPWLQARGIQNVVCCISENTEGSSLGGVTNMFRAQELPVYSLRIHSKLHIFRSLRLLWLIYKEKPDILHTYLFHANILGRLTRIFFPKIKVVSSVVSTDDWKRPHHVWLERLTSMFCHRILVNAQAVKRCLVERDKIAPDRISVVYNGVDLTRVYRQDSRQVSSLKAKLNIQDTDYVIGFVGRLHREKNPAFLIRCFNGLLQDIPNAKLLLVGEGKLRQSLEDLCQTLGIEDKVIFAGDVGLDIGSYYSCMSVMAICSLFEGIPGVLFEAMHLRIPVVSLKLGGIPEVVKNRESAVLVSENTHTAFAAGLKQIYSDKELVQLLKDNAQKLVLQKYLLADNFKERLALYEEVRVKHAVREQVSRRDQRTRVVHLIYGLQMGGAETMLYKLLVHSDQTRFDHHVISMAGHGVFGEKLRQCGIQVHVLGMSSWSFDLRKPLKLIRLVRELQPDVLQTWLYHGDLWGLLAAKFNHTPILAWNIRCSNAVEKSSSILSKLRLRLLVLFASIPNVVIVNSRAGIRHHSALGYRPRRWEYIPNGFDTKVYTPDPEARAQLHGSLGIPTSSFVIGMMARFDPLKDHATFLRAAARLLEKSSSVHFILAGAGVTRNNEQLMEWVSRTQRPENFHLLGQQDDVVQILAGLDLFTLTSISEGFPNALGEAMACGLPCIATDVGDAADILANPERVVVVHDDEMLAQKWAQVMALSPEERRALGQAGRERIESQYSLTQVVRRYEDLYEGLTMNWRQAYGVSAPNPMAGAVGELGEQV